MEQKVPLGRGRGRGVAPRTVPAVGGPKPAVSVAPAVKPQAAAATVAPLPAAAVVTQASSSIDVASKSAASSDGKAVPSSQSTTSIAQLTEAAASLSLMSQSSSGAGGDAAAASADTISSSQQQQPPETKKSSNSVSGDSTGSKSSSEMIPIETRPSYGLLGRRLKLRSNYFRLSVKADQDGNVLVHHYRIEITHVKKVLKRDELRELFWEIIITQSNFVQEPWTLFYDGGNAFYTQKKIPVPANFEMSYRFALPSDLRPSDYSVKITYIGELTIDVNSTTINANRFTVNNMLDLLFHQYYSLPQKFIENEKKRFVNAGRSFYYIPVGPNDSMPLSRTCEIWQGYFAASKLGRQNSLYLNFDTSHTTFFAMKSALEFLCDSLNNAFNTNMYNIQGLSSDTVLPDRLIKAFEKEIKSMKITTTHNNTERVYKVISVSDLSAADTKFQRNDVTTSVAEYFAQVYNMTLRFPRLPCLVVGTKKRSISLPLEVCMIHRPQKYNRKLNEKQTADMIKAVCIDAPSREDRIARLMSMARFESDPFLRSFGVRVEKDMIMLEARLFDPPSIKFGNKEVEPRQGVWSVDRSCLYQCAPSTDYALVSMVDERESPKLERFCNALCQSANQLGIKNFRLPAKVIYLKSVEQIESTIKELQSSYRCTFFIFVLDRKNTQIYGEIKRLGDVAYGVITQCVLMRVVQDPKPMTMANLVLKINAKFGGVNSMICGAEIIERYMTSREDGTTMFMGIDVTHPGPTDRHTPSIAAVVSTIDPSPARYGASINVQKFRREALTYVTDAIRERVYAFYAQCGKAPRRIVVYRDGVSEGQFAGVLKDEVNKIRAACEEMSAGFKPKITFIVVQKRHHTRFFCADQRDTAGKARNIPPGTVVDSEITNPESYDFFICSHFGIQGTSRPSHYHVLLDENKLSPDELQQMTYFLCHMYARCTRSVSIPAPVYYAHLACARARNHLFRVVGTDDISSSHSGEGTSSVSDDSASNAVKIHDFHKSKMYFC